MPKLAMNYENLIFNIKSNNRLKSYNNNISLLYN